MKWVNLKDRKPPSLSEAIVRKCKSPRLENIETMRELFYYSDYKLPNRVTVCGLYEDGGLRLSCARLSDSDRFVRKIGRAKARGRAISHPIVTVSAVPENVTTQVFLDHAKRLAEEVRKNPNFTKESFQL